jgi:hypothetical protein
MEPKDPFENKIKSALEEYAPAYEQGAWEDFAPRLESLNIPFWKKWYAPYLYSTGLAGLIWLYLALQTTPGISISQAYLPPDNQTITLVQRDTLYVYDTVYVYRRQIIDTQIFSEESSGIASTLDLNGNNLNQPISEETKATAIESTFKSDTNTDESKGITESATRQVARQNAPRAGATAPSKSQTDSTYQETIANTESIDTESGLPVSPNKTRTRTSMAAPSINRQKLEVLKTDREFVEGDTSNLSSPPIRQKQKNQLSLYAKPALTLLLPIHSELEFYPAILPELSVELRWNDSFGLSTGLIWGNITADLDDPEDFPAGYLNRFPGLPDLSEEPDDVEIRSEQLWIPLIASLRPVASGRFDINIQVGFLINYLRSQRFTYIFEEQSMLADFSEKVKLNEWTVSHAMIGVGSGYSISERMSLQMGATYWLPLVKTGVDQSRIHGLGLNFGLNYRLWKRTNF